MKGSPIKLVPSSVLEGIFRATTLRARKKFFHLGHACLYTKTSKSAAYKTVQDKRTQPPLKVTGIGEYICRRIVTLARGRKRYTAGVYAGLG